MIFHKFLAHICTIYSIHRLDSRAPLSDDPQPLIVAIATVSIRDSIESLDFAAHCTEPMGKPLWCVSSDSNGNFQQIPMIEQKPKLAAAAA